jgi:tetratricopeptide (TPR) repeat protein
MTLVKLGRWNEAIMQLGPVARAAPNRIMARTYFAWALAGRGDFDEAIAQLQRILRMKPDFGPARDALQQIQLEKGQERGFFLLKTNRLRQRHKSFKPAFVGNITVS